MKAACNFHKSKAGHLNGMYFSCSNERECVISDLSKDYAMKTSITATELARNLSRVLDQLITEGGEVVIERNSRRVACLAAVPAQQTALEAMADLYRTLPGDAASSWEADSRNYSPKKARADKGMRDPWAS